MGSWRQSCGYCCSLEQLMQLDRYKVYRKFCNQWLIHELMNWARRLRLCDSYLSILTKCQMMRDVILFWLLVVVLLLLSTNIDAKPAVSSDQGDVNSTVTTIVGTFSQESMTGKLHQDGDRHQSLVNFNTSGSYQGRYPSKLGQSLVNKREKTTGGNISKSANNSLLSSQNSVSFDHINSGGKSRFSFPHIMTPLVRNQPGGARPSEEDRNNQKPPSSAHSYLYTHRTSVTGNWSQNDPLKPKPAAKENDVTVSDQTHLDMNQHQSVYDDTRTLYQTESTTQVMGSELAGYTSVNSDEELATGMVIDTDTLPYETSGNTKAGDRPTGRQTGRGRFLMKDVRTCPPWFPPSQTGYSPHYLWPTPHPAFPPFNPH